MGAGAAKAVVRVARRHAPATEILMVGATFLAEDYGLLFHQISDSAMDTVLIYPSCPQTYLRRPMLHRACS